MLPTIPFTHVVITFNKSKHFITKEEDVGLRMQPNGVLVKLGDSTINTSSISEILSLEDYYRLNPDERPQETNIFELPKEKEVSLESQIEGRERALRGLLASLAHFIENHGTNKYLAHEFERWKKSYKTRYGKEFEYDETDRARVIESFREKDIQGNPKINCKPCLDAWFKPTELTQDTISQF